MRHGHARWDKASRAQCACHHFGAFSPVPELLNPFNLHIAQWSHVISEYSSFEQKYTVFQVVTTGYHRSMCGRSCEPLLVPVRNSNRLVVAVVLRVRVWGNSCSWGSKFHQLILTPLAAWPSRFLPLVSDDCVENVAFSWTGHSTVY